MLKIFFIPFWLINFKFHLSIFWYVLHFFGGGGSGIGYADRPKTLSVKLKSFLDYGL